MLYDNLVFKQTKAIFGGRCRFLITSSAPISKDVIDFMKVISCSPMVEGYGQTESTGASFATVYEDAETGTTGGPCASVEFKLVDIPEMNYLSTDKVNQHDKIVAFLKNIFCFQNKFRMKRAKINQEVRFALEVLVFSWDITRIL